MTLHTFGAAGTYVCSKFAAVGFPDAESLALARALGAALVLLVLALTVLPRPRFSPRDWLALAGLGLLLTWGNQYLFLRGMRTTATGHPALLYALTPALVLLLNSLLRRTLPSGRRLLGVVIALAGVFVLLQPWNQASVARELRVGDFWLLWAVLAWAIYTIVAGPLCQKHGTATVTAWSLILGGVLFIPIAGSALWRLELNQVSGQAWGGLLWMILVTSVAMMFIWNFLLRFLHPVEVSICTNAQPIATVLLTAVLTSLGILAGEQDLSPRFLFGLVLVLVGIAVVQWQPSWLRSKSLAG